MDSKTIKKYIKNKEIIFYNERITHDGFDCYGPESNIFTLTIIVKNNLNKYILYLFNKEYWFNNIVNDYDLILIKELQKSDLKLYINN